MDSPASPPLLSICLPTVTNRAHLFAELKAEVDRQCKGHPVEVLVACDSKQISIGKKRQNLLEEAKGKYVVYIDDDDAIAKDYVEQIISALQTEPDCVGFLVECTFNGRGKCLAKASSKYKDWAENVDGYRYVRSPYQKTPIKREIALQVGFPDLRFGEDLVYSRAVVKLIKSEVFIDKVLYYYKFVSERHDTKYGFPRKGIVYTHTRRKRVC